MRRWVGVEFVSRNLSQNEDNHEEVRAKKGDPAMVEEMEEEEVKTRLH